MRHTGLRLFTGLLVTHVLALSAPVTNSARNSLEMLSDDESILFANEKEFLDPDVAFQLMAEQVSENRIVTEWRIAEGYYLYREKFGFVLAAGEDGVLRAQLGEPHYPPGKLKTDQFFGEMEIYQSDTQIVLPLKAARAPSAKPPLTLRASYQGCAEAGICYPPTTKTVVLHGGVTAAKALLPTEVKISEQDQIARRLASRDWLLVISIFLGAGLALAFTPCVLPMIPILSGIIVGEGERLNTRSAFTLSLTYVMAMALMYAVAGAVAGVSGHNLQAMFQNPSVLVAFSAVFVLLALSMFGFYELQLPSRWQSKLAVMSNKHGGGTYGGVAVMGALSAIIVGPCVAPPLAGARIYIGQTGDAVLGGAALFSMALGMGAPLLVIGTTAGRWLPRAGAWMDSVKRVFGVLLLGVAVWLLERILPGPVTMVLWASLLSISAVFLGAMEGRATEGAGWRRLRKGAGIVMLVYGAPLIVGAAGGGTEVFRPLGRFTDGAKSQHNSPVFERIKSVDDLQIRLAGASIPTMLDFYADWCVECKQMERRTFTDPRVQRVLGGVNLLQADVTANDAEDRALLKSLGLYGPPAILFFEPNGVERTDFRLVGFVDAARFSNHVEALIGQ